MKVTGAATFAFAIFGTLALPSHATQEVAEVKTAKPLAAKQQSINVTAGPALTPIDEIPLEVDTTIAQQEQREREIKAARDKARQQAKINAVDVPAGVGASGLVQAALAQVGQHQDCTALVERSLRAVGIGVGDLGPAQFAAFGPNVQYIHGSTALAPGDILIWGNAHVAIYVGNGAVVHGGWTGGNTVVAGLGTYHGLPTKIVRMS